MQEETTSKVIFFSNLMHLNNYLRKIEFSYSQYLQQVSK